MGNKGSNSNQENFQTPISSIFSKIQKNFPKPPPPPPPKPQIENMNIILGLIDKNKPKMLHFDYTTETIKQVDPPTFPIFNYSSLVMLDSDHIYLTGGISYDLKEITKISYEMNTSTPIKFSKLPDLNVARYAHMSIIHKGNLYVFGGRTYGLDDGIMNNCEMLDLPNLSKNFKWNSIALMNKPRCTGFVVIYQEQIYVFGGYTGAKKRSRKIERYNEPQNVWEILDFKLKEGVEAGSIYPIDLDEFVIVGGNNKDGLSNKAYLYNIQEASIKEYPYLNNPRVLQKTFIDYQRANIYVLGGDVGNTCEKLAYLTNEIWELLPNVNLEEIGNTIEIKSFCHLTSSTMIHSVTEKKPKTKKQKEFSKKKEEKKYEFVPIGNPFENLPPAKEKKGNPYPPEKNADFLDSVKNFFEKKPLELKKEETIKQEDFKNEDEEDVLPDENDHRMYLFGTDTESIIIEYNLSKNKARPIEVQAPLKLQCYQSGVKTSDSCYFISGGINTTLDKIFEETFLYMSLENTTFKIESMHTPRYTFNLVLQHPWVYALGGRTYGSDEVGVLNTCERYHLELQFWEQIAPLNFKRCTAMAFSWSNGIYMAGGYMGSLKREKRFECYIESVNKWELMGIELEEALEASALLVSDDKLLFIGGRIQAGDTDKIWSYDFANGFDAFHGEQVGKMKLSRCLHKSYKLDKNNFLVLGGNCYDNLFETFAYDKEKNAIINNGEKAYDFMRKVFLRHIRKHFKESHLHKNLLL